jgi:hypothetical protein
VRRSKNEVRKSAARNPVQQLLRSARSCRIRDLQQLAILARLVNHTSELTHALQKERGVSAIYLGSNGGQFAAQLATRIADSHELELAVRQQLEHIDDKLDRMSSGARFYVRVALALRALDGLATARQQIAALAMAPQDAVRAFTNLIGCLLAVGFEVADVAADPVISKAMLALVTFSQGKEYAGQERATIGGVFSLGTIEVADLRRHQHLILSQDQAFQHFSDFAEPRYVAAFETIVKSGDSAEVRRMRHILSGGSRTERIASATADAWYRHTTSRIDAMKAIEGDMATGIGGLCDSTLSTAESADEVPELSPVAMVVTDIDPSLNQLGLEGGVGLYILEAGMPRPMRSILDVIRAQSRQIDDMTSQLESARVALAERKTIERAKGLLMQSRRMPEKEAYALIRETAMNQNKRIFEIAEAIVSMSNILKT